MVQRRDDTLQVQELIDFPRGRFWAGRRIFSVEDRSGAMATLFSCGFKRKTSQTSAEEIEQAAAARADKESAEFMRLKEKAAEMKAVVAHSLNSLLGDKKTPCQSKDAIRKRKERAALRKTAAKKAAKQAETPRERAAIDAEKCDIQSETHYTDVKGRMRKRKTNRTRIASQGVITKGGSRKWTPAERSLSSSCTKRSTRLALRIMLVWHVSCMCGSRKCLVRGLLERPLASHIRTFAQFV